jgi:hypothetical protein
MVDYKNEEKIIGALQLSPTPIVVSAIGSLSHLINICNLE